jgi:hypothetical protein
MRPPAGAEDANRSPSPKQRRTHSRRKTLRTRVQLRSAGPTSSPNERRNRAAEHNSMALDGAFAWTSRS